MTEEAKRAKRIAIIASKGTLDMAYPPLILASTAASMGMEAAVFFTLYGFDIINKNKCRKLKVSPVGNPAMPTPVPIPNIVGVLPGMTAGASMAMKKMIKKIGWPTIPELLSMCRESGVKLIACSPTMLMTGVTQQDLVEGCEISGAAEFLSFAADADITLSF